MLGITARQQPPTHRCCQGAHPGRDSMLATRLLPLPRCVGGWYPPPTPPCHCCSLPSPSGRGVVRPPPLPPAATEGGREPLAAEGGRPAPLLLAPLPLLMLQVGCPEQSQRPPKAARSNPGVLQFRNRDGAALSRRGVLKLWTLRWKKQIPHPQPSLSCPARSLPTAAEKNCKIMESRGMPPNWAAPVPPCTDHPPGSGRLLLHLHCTSLGAPGSVAWLPSVGGVRDSAIASLHPLTHT